MNLEGISKAHLVSANIQITEATWLDLSGLRRLEAEVFTIDAWPLWDLIGVLSSSQVVTLKATMAKRMVGFIAGDPRPEEELGWITTLGVLRDFRRLGIASTLLAACEQVMEVPRVLLCVRYSNQGALKLYQNTGYRQVDLRRGYYIDGEDARVMEKKLTSRP